MNIVGRIVSHCQKRRALGGTQPFVAVSNVPSRAELIEVLVTEVLLLGVMVVALSRPETREPFLWCWLVPALGAATVLAFAFDYLPHRPHEARGRYRDTRAYPGSLLHALLLAQNYHLVHHLWTTIPWFRYRRAFEGVRPELEQRGCRID